MPAVGATVTVSVTPSLSTSTAEAFPINDVVIVAENSTAGDLIRIGYFAVDSTPVGDNVTLRALARVDPESPLATTGDAFPANCEITGQTRLPARPAGATRCEIVVSESTLLTNAAANSADVAHDAASKIVGGLFPVMRAGIKMPAGADIDLVERSGTPVNLYGSISFESEVQMAAARLVCSTTNRFKPVVEATFYGV